MKRKINTLYFSATGTTQRIVLGIAQELVQLFGFEAKDKAFNFTWPEFRACDISYTEDDLVIVGVPVYAGRVPNVLLDFLNTVKGNGALAVPVVVYGNRNYDDALIELKDILEEDGFKVIAGGAFIGEHAFSETLAQNRPDEKDMAIVRGFAHQIYSKIITQKKLPSIYVKGNKPYRKYYMPKDKEDNSVDIRKVTPKTNDSCIDCKLCVNVCPMGSIDHDNVAKLNGICIKCGACIKNCPVDAKYYDDPGYLEHKLELEINFTERREPELFME